MGQIKFMDGYTTLAVYNGMRYLFCAPDVTEIDMKNGAGLWELVHKDQCLYLVNSTVKIENCIAYFEKGTEFLVASFNGESYEVGDGLPVLEVAYDSIPNFEPLCEFLRETIKTNECLYKLFFFNGTFKDRMQTNKRRMEENVSYNVLRNIVTNGLSSLEKVLTGCSMDFFASNICGCDMGLNNDKKKLKQVLGLPPVVIELLKSSTYSHLYPKFKELAEEKDVNDAVFLVEYIQLLQRVEDETGFRSSNSKSAFLDYMLDIAIMSKSSMKTIINYLHNQQFSYRENSGGFSMPYSEALAMRDYLAIAKKYNLDVDGLPSNLRAAHFYIQNNICYAGNEQKDNEFKEAVEKYKHLEMKGKKYSVIVPESVDAMIKEGMDMHHCIASYIDMVCKGAIVLFLRKTEATNESLVSFEVDESGEFVQIKGKYDADIEQTEEDSENNEIIAFLLKWRKKKFESGEEEE